MNQIEMEHLKRITEISANRGEAIELLVEKNIKLRAELARLTAGSEAMQEDARNNTATIKAQAEEIRTLKQELDQLKACKHMHVKIHSRLYRPSTREEPAEFEYKAECKDCGELFSADDVDEWAEVEE